MELKEASARYFAALKQQIPECYKQTEVGLIPDDWVIMPVALLGETKRGAGSLCIKYKQSGGVRLIRINDFFQDNPVLVEATDEIKKYLIGERDLLFAGTGASAGASYLPKQEWIGLPHSYNAPRIRVFESHCKAYLLYSLQSDYVIRQQRAWFVGNAQPFLDTKAISNFSIAVPPTKVEQEAIAEALSDADVLIEALEQLIAKKRQLKQGAMQELLTGKRRLPGFSGEWKVKPFDEVLLRKNAKAHQIQTSDYQTTGLYPVVDQGKALVIGFSDLHKKHFRCPDDGVIVFGDHTCIVKFVDFDFLVGADGTQILTANEGQCTRFYFYQLEYKGIQSTGYNRHFKILKERLFLSPSCPEQIAIATILSDMDAEIAELKTRLAKARAVKQGMMQQLLTGKIRLV